MTTFSNGFMNMWCIDAHIHIPYSLTIVAIVDCWHMLSLLIRFSSVRFPSDSKKPTMRRKKKKKKIYFTVVEYDAMRIIVYSIKFLANRISALWKLIFTQWKFIAKLNLQFKSVIEFHRSLSTVYCLFV